MSGILTNTTLSWKGKFMSNKYEQWLVQNTTEKIYTIGDLINVPAVGPKQQINLLTYTTKNKIEQSQDLRNLLANGTFKLVKQKNNKKVSIPEKQKTDHITNAEEAEISISKVNTFKKDGNIDYADHMIFANTSNQSISLNLPDATKKTGKNIIIKKITTDSNSIKINTTKNQTIDGSNSKTINDPYVSISLITNGYNWFII